MYDRFLDILLEASKKTPSQIKAARRKANLAAQGKTPGSMAAAASQAAQTVYRGTAKPRPQLGNNPTRAVATVTSRDVVPTTTKSVVPSVKKPGEVLPALRKPGALARVGSMMRARGTRSGDDLGPRDAEFSVVNTNGEKEDEKKEKEVNIERLRSQFRNKLTGLLRKGTNLTNIKTPTSVY